MSKRAGILSWAIVSVATGGAVWWLLSRESAAGRWLLALVLFGHGAVHLLFGAPAPESDADWPFDMGRSWTITRAGLDPGVVRIAGWSLVALVVAGSVGATLSTIPVLVPAAWWEASVAGAAITSTVLLALFFSPRLVLGLAIDAVLLWLALSGVWMP